MIRPFYQAKLNLARASTTMLCYEVYLNLTTQVSSQGTMPRCGIKYAHLGR
jgi:hypothetical protein